MTNPQESPAPAVPQPPQPSHPGESYPVPQQRGAQPPSGAQLVHGGQPGYGAQPGDSGGPYPGQQYPGQQYGGQPHGGQPYGGQPYGGQYSGQAQAYPDQQYGGQQYGAYGGGQAGYGYPRAGYPPPGYGYPQPGYPQPYVEDPTAVVGTRVGQYLLDGILVGVPVIALMIGMFTVFTSDDTISGIGFPLLVLVGYGLSWGSQAWWPSRHSGQTPAMGWLNLRIVTAQGGVPGIGALSARWLLLLVDGSFFGLVGFVIMMCTSRHQRLGDIAASTYVVRAG